MSEEHLPIAEIIHSPTEFSGAERLAYYGLKRCDVRPGSNGKPYAALVLADRSGEIPAKVWSNGKQASELVAGLAPGMVVKVQFAVETYEAKPVLIVSRIREARSDEYDPSDVVPTTAKDTAAMLDKVRQVADTIQNPHLHALVTSLYFTEGFEARLLSAAASVDFGYAYRGGLLEMIHDALLLAEALPQTGWAVDHDLVLAGVLLAGVGRMRAIESGLVMAATDEGELLGHVVLALEEVTQAIALLPDFPAELAIKVKHIVASQNGRLEWGSPRMPQMAEAAVVYHLLAMAAAVNKLSHKEG